ncbi:hypothetical protein BSKO_06099 [Bryopsis sp. KO-2023]|nr:hypothetical protein BSKO_06099 [Bryopsis sp. KO-2023]
MAAEQAAVAVGQEELQSQQLRFVVYHGDRRVRWSGEWSYAESVRAGASGVSSGGELGAPPAPSNLAQATLNIVQAPACFCEPITQKKPFKPPFKVRLDLRYTGSLQLPVKLEACALTEQVVEQLSAMHKEGAPLAALPSLPQQQELEHSCISSCIQTHDALNGLGTPAEIHLCAEDLEFTDLRFGKSSRMHRRWILFSCRLGRDVVYLLYKLPTIVLSRKTDQFDKASSILQKKGMRTPGLGLALVEGGPANEREAGGAAAAPLLGGEGLFALPPIVTRVDVNGGAVPSGEAWSPQSPKKPAYVKAWISEKYGAAGMCRILSEHDLMYLETKACSHYGRREAGNYGEFDKSRDWSDFQHWFLVCLRSLKQEEQLWGCVRPMKICDFTVDRAIAEDLLQDEPFGTFVVRLCSEPGGFAISVKMEPTTEADAGVHHYLVDALDLRRQKLEMWIGLHCHAKHFLDVLTGRKLAKSTVFPGGIPAMQAIGQTRQELPIPLLSSTPVPTAAQSMAPRPPEQMLSLAPLLPPPPPPPPPTSQQPRAVNTLLNRQPSLLGGFMHAHSSSGLLGNGDFGGFVPIPMERPAKPTPEQVLQLAADCGFDVSGGLNQILLSGAQPLPSPSQPPPPELHQQPPTMEQVSELARFCGIDIHLLQKESPPSTAALPKGNGGFLFGGPPLSTAAVPKLSGGFLFGGVPTAATSSRGKRERNSETNNTTTESPSPKRSRLGPG